MHVETQLLPFISVVVPIRNEEPFIRRTVDQLLAQKYDPDRFEVIVVDGHSTDATRNIVGGLCKEHPNLELLHNPRRLASSARNIGVRHARGDIVVFVDGHCDLGQPLSDLASRACRCDGRSGATLVCNRRFGSHRCQLESDRAWIFRNGRRIVDGLGRRRRSRIQDEWCPAECPRRDPSLFVLESGHAVCGHQRPQYRQQRHGRPRRLDLPLPLK